MVDSVVDVYKCVPVDEVVDMESNFSGRVYLPQSLLGIILGVHEDIPPVLHFSIECKKNGKRTHCSVKEFTAEEGQVYLPRWMMAQLELTKDDNVTLSLVQLLPGVKATFRIDQQDKFLPNDPITVLEQKLRHYSCLTLGDALEIELLGIVFTVTVTQLEPASAVSIINIDLNIDIEWEEKKQLEVQPGEHTKPDFKWKSGFIRFSRYEKRPDRPQKESKTAFPGQGHRLENNFDEQIKEEPKVYGCPIQNEDSLLQPDDTDSES